MSNTFFSPLRTDIELLSNHGLHFDQPWQVVDRFEKEISSFFGSRFGVATDSCTHALELCLRALKHSETVILPRHTYMSVPMMLEKTSIPYELATISWEKQYDVIPNILIDAATLWERNAYRRDRLMCISFQFKKHLPIGRGGMILLDDQNLYTRLQRMVRDGRDPMLTQFQDDVTELGYHYYMTPEDAARGLHLFEHLKDAFARPWTWRDYRDLTEMSYFRNRI
jgi:dTDP-4-amino-4,6-dideoxygalactose transaminase